MKHEAKKHAENYMLREWDQIIFHEEIPKLLVGKQELKNNASVIEHRMYKQWLSWDSLILYEDEDRLVWNKPAGIVAHEGNKHTEDITMNQLLETYTSFLPSPNEWAEGEWMARRGVGGGVLRTKNYELWTTFKPAFAFRLDKDTTGVLVSAKTYPALQHINQLIRDHDITKIYISWIIWKPDFSTIAKNYNYDFDGAEMVINEPLFKWFNASTWHAQTFVNSEKWLPSQTIVSIQKTVVDPILGSISLVQCKLLSGRMHQIRAHLAYIGYAVLGDVTYGSPVTSRLLYKHYKINRQLLHSYQYEFIDHHQKTISVIAPMPEEFGKLERDREIKREITKDSMR